MIKYGCRVPNSAWNPHRTFFFTPALDGPGGPSGQNGQYTLLAGKAVHLVHLVHLVC